MSETDGQGVREEIVETEVVDVDGDGTIDEGELFAESVVAVREDMIDDGAADD